MVDPVQNFTVLWGLHLGLQLHKNLQMQFRSRVSLLSFEKLSGGLPMITHFT